MSRVHPHPCLSAVFECRSLSRCRTRTRQRIGDDPKFPRCRAWGRTGGTGSLPSGSITQLSGRTAHFDLTRTDHIKYSFQFYLSPMIMFLTSPRLRLCPRCVVCVLLLALSVGPQILNSYWEYCSIEYVHMCAYMYRNFAPIHVAIDRWYAPNKRAYLQ